MPRLNDTDAIRKMPLKGKGALQPAMNAGESLHISIRPIDNGFIRSESKYGKDGSYSSSETYHPQHPDATDQSPKTNSSLKDAVKYLKK
jgi:hypothetical protein